MNVPFDDSTNELTSDEFLMLVGTRVRERRKELKLSRRVLSEASGVSERYLAQLEGGAGNISVGLLRRIAQALDLSIAQLVSEDNSSIAFSELYLNAGADQRRQVMEILDPATPGRLRGKRIALIGLRGAGKSTLGRTVSSRLGLPFMELNDEIRANAGMPLDEIFALYGAEGYRQLEAEALCRVADARETVVLGTGGGIVTQPETFRFLVKHYHTIWIKASPEDHMSRVLAQGDRRPVEGTPQAMTVLKSILAKRTTRYSQADRSIDTSNRSLSDSANDLTARIKELLT